MSVTASQLRANIYRILDEVLDTGEPVEIRRGARLLRIVAVDQPEGPDTSWRLRIQPHPEHLAGDPEHLVDMDWSSEWKP